MRAVISTQLSSILKLCSVRLSLYIVSMPDGISQTILSTFPVGGIRSKLTNFGGALSDSCHISVMSQQRESNPLYIIASRH